MSLAFLRFSLRDTFYSPIFNCYPSRKSNFSIYHLITVTVVFVPIELKTKRYRMMNRFKTTAHDV